MKEQVLCHACCAVCSAYPLQKIISDDYEPVLYFYNPNIYPKAEYERRLEELKKYCEKYNYNLIIDEDDEVVWQNFIKGYENEPEKGKRCKKCFEIRLDKTAQKAKELGVNKISTTLTVSPHKSSEMIFTVLSALKTKYCIEYLEFDFKKEDGFLKSMQTAKDENFYRQNYCGCRYSLPL